MRNNSGKALTIFLVLIAIILVSLTAISVFLLIKQVQLREAAEYNVDQLKASESTLKSKFESVKKDRDLLVQKTKEAELKIESLLEELDLAEGVRDEVKKENRELRDSLDGLKKTSEALTEQLQVKEEEAQQRVSEIQGKLDAAVERNKALDAERQSLEQEFKALQEKLETGKVESETEAMDAGVEGEEGANVDLSKIVITAESGDDGVVVSIDKDADFVIVSLGERNGVKEGAKLSIYDGETYLGDILVTKVLPEMSAADFVSPLTSQDVSEGNIVRTKE